ncbi:MAG TPA: hypothetical protein VH575_31405 [Gemmataceae bacterium]
MKSTSSAALFAALGLFTVVGIPSAKAADLGGDCCADLEERVAELEATTARKGNRKVSLTISGQVSTMVMGWSDGNNDRGSDAYIVDNVMSGGTYFALSGSAKINPNLSAGFNVTVAMDTGGRSHQVNQLDDDGTTGTGPRGAGGFDTDIVITLANWYLDHKQLGRVTVGRANTATAGLTTIDLGGAGVIANANIGYTQRGLFLALNDNLQDGTWASALGGNTVNGSGLSRGNVISYSTPTVGGFSASAAWGEDDVWDAALRYAGEFSGFRLAAGIGYAHNDGGVGDFTEEFSGPGNKISQIKGSASVMHVATGLYLTGAFVNQDNDNSNPNTKLWYVQGGIAKNWTGLGNTVLYGEYARVDDGIVCGAGGCVDFGGNAGDIINSSEARVWGLGVVQHIDAAAMEVFLAYRRYSADVTSPAGNLLNGTVDYNDMDVVMGGARVKF